MKNSALTPETLDKINSCNLLIKLIEEQEKELRTSLAKRRLNYRGRHENLIGYKKFFLEHELTKEAAAIEFDLQINEKAIGKRELKKGGEVHGA